MAEETTTKPPLGAADLEQLVAEADTGGRKPTGVARRVLFVVAVAWSAFQLWYASPLPFVLGVGILNDTQARAIHLAFAFFLAFLAYPASKRAPRTRIPIADWVLALVAAVTSAYLFVFHRELALRPGMPTAADLVTALLGIVLLLEATRRALGPPMVVVGLVFLAYTFLGPYMPEVIQHKGASLTKTLTHQWLTTEGVFGTALGVSTSFVFLFVLFGSLLEKAGAGNYMMQVSFALLGHLRGGPAKVAVVSSALNGVVSGSSISNVVSGGIFTIPMMRRTGLSAVKAGAIETASSINGQIMPPVMGAAAFLMVEYVGIPYSEIIRHAFLPAVISYVALFYIVHIEALKLGTQPLARRTSRPLPMRLLRLGLGIAGTIVLAGVVYYGVGALEALLGSAAGPVLVVLLVAAYVASVWYASRFPDLELDDPNAPVFHLPETWPTVRTGLHFLLPLAVLLWCLMVEMLSPGLSAFWGTAAMIAIVLTQRPLFAWFRGQGAVPAFRQGWRDFIEGMELGARNMIAIGIATATAGIVVGTITLTGLGFMMTDFVEFISGGNVILMLVLTAMISLVLGMGIPTTANYIIVATLMAPVIVELGAQAGLAIPLIAVHLFVFYFGIMADVTPPVGLASYAAAAISGADPIKTGLQGSVYALRTVLLPFFFIFEPTLLLMDLHSWGETLLVIAAATLGMLVFAAATMGFFLTRSRLWETAALLLVTFTLLRPGFWMDRIAPPYEDASPARLEEVVAATPPKGRLQMRVEGLSIEGDDVRKVVSVRLDTAGTPAERLAAAGLALRRTGEDLQVAQVRFGSYAERLGLEPGFRITAVRVPTARPPAALFYIPALLLLGVVVAAQRARRGARPAATPGVPDRPAAA
ncbi:MAG TPA: TRAP transporter permease [Thermodesulfobacteriota bacterium]